MDGNIAFDRALHEPGTGLGWDAETSARLGWQQWKRRTPSIEYYSALGELGKLSPLADQTHLVFLGADWRIGERLTWSFGMGVGTTDGTREVVLKSRLEYEFGRMHDYAQQVTGH